MTSYNINPLSNSRAIHPSPLLVTQGWKKTWHMRPVSRSSLLPSIRMRMATRRWRVRPMRATVHNLPYTCNHSRVRSCGQTQVTLRRYSNAFTKSRHRLSFYVVQTEYPSMAGLETNSIRNNRSLKNWEREREREMVINKEKFETELKVRGRLRRIFHVACAYSWNTGIRIYFHPGACESAPVNILNKI
jgi:hypothetical protein